MDINENKIHDYNLFSEKDFFFTPIFCENSFFKTQLVRRYSDGISSWKKRINSGRLRVDSKTKQKYAQITGSSAEDILAIYIEKRRMKYAMILFNNQMIIDDVRYNIEDLKIIACNLSCKGENIDILLTEEVAALIYDLQHIIEYENSESDFHPCRRIDYTQRENYIKVLIIFCAINVGITADQLIHITNVSKEFEIKSKFLLPLFELIYEYPKENLLDMENGGDIEKKALIKGE